MNFLEQAQLHKKRVLVRCDFNVPVDNQGAVLDDFRLAAAKETILHGIRQGAKMILLSHLDRPEGKVVERFRLNGIQRKLAELLGMEVLKTDDCVGKEAHDAISRMKEGEVLLLENVRFYGGEEEGKEDFARELAQLGDLYINEAFSVNHRSHASVAILPRLLPAFAGFGLVKELQALEPLLKNPARPMVVIVGGTKVKTKSDALDAISEIADAVLLSNLIAAEIKSKGLRLKNMTRVHIPVDSNPGNGLELDIGPATIELFCEILKSAKTVCWSGPVGKIEEREYEKGSLALANAVMASGAYSVAGGGDLVAFLRRKGLQEKFSHVSSGGGALLAFLAGDRLPGLEALGYYDGN